ncbi:TlpA family protein disulfide reductase [Nonomuraea sp. GTA35]|uniref:TlpA family protein disulfide reductase n=1 Tax=Nonomuraea sp. GTA35 TaxID=1676746 RepID=UPI0035C0D60B
MSYLIAVVAFVGVLCAVDLVLTLGVVRRLKEHTKLIDALYEAVDLMGGPPGAGGRLAVGDVVGEFEATTTDGTRLTRDLLPDGTVIAFLSPDCQGCHDKLPAFAAWAAGQDRARVVAVLDDRAGEPGEMLGMLLPVAQVVVDGAVSRAFGVPAYPTFLQVAAGGRLLAVGPEISRLPAGAPA